MSNYPEDNQDKEQNINTTSNKIQNMSDSAAEMNVSSPISNINLNKGSNTLAPNEGENPTEPPNFIMTNSNRVTTYWTEDEKKKEEKEGIKRAKVLYALENINDLEGLRNFLFEQFQGQENKAYETSLYIFRIMGLFKYLFMPCPVGQEIYKKEIVLLLSEQLGYFKNRRSIILRDSDEDKIILQNDVDIPGNKMTGFFLFDASFAFYSFDMKQVWEYDVFFNLLIRNFLSIHIRKLFNEIGLNYNDYYDEGFIVQFSKEEYQTVMNFIIALSLRVQNEWVRIGQINLMNQLSFLFCIKESNMLSNIILSGIFDDMYEPENDLINKIAYLAFLKQEDTDQYFKELLLNEEKFDYDNKRKVLECLSYMSHYTNRVRNYKMSYGGLVDEFKALIQENSSNSTDVNYYYKNDKIFLEDRLICYKVSKYLGIDKIVGIESMKNIYRFINNIIYNNENFYEIEKSNDDELIILIMIISISFIGRQYIASSNLILSKLIDYLKKEFTNNLVQNNNTFWTLIEIINLYNYELKAIILTSYQNREINYPEINYLFPNIFTNSNDIINIRMINDEKNERFGPKLFSSNEDRLKTVLQYMKFLPEKYEWIIKLKEIKDLFCSFIDIMRKFSGTNDDFHFFFNLLYTLTWTDIHLRDYQYIIGYINFERIYNLIRTDKLPYLFRCSLLNFCAKVLLCVREMNEFYIQNKNGENEIVIQQNKKLNQLILNLRKNRKILLERTRELKEKIDKDQLVNKNTMGIAEVNEKINIIISYFACLKRLESLKDIEKNPYSLHNFDIQFIAEKRDCFSIYDQYIDNKCIFDNIQYDPKSLFPIQKNSYSYIYNKFGNININDINYYNFMINPENQINPNIFENYNKFIKFKKYHTKKNIISVIFYIEDDDDCINKPNFFKNQVELYIEKFINDVLFSEKIYLFPKDILRIYIKIFSSYSVNPKVFESKMKAQENEYKYKRKKYKIDTIKKLFIGRLMWTLNIYANFEITLWEVCPDSNEERRLSNYLNSLILLIQTFGEHFNDYFSEVFNDVKFNIDLEYSSTMDFEKVITDTSLNNKYSRKLTAFELLVDIYKKVFSKLYILYCNENTLQYPKEKDNEKVKGIIKDKEVYAIKNNLLIIFNSLTSCIKEFYQNNSDQYQEKMSEVLRNFFKLENQNQFWIYKFYEVFSGKYSQEIDFMLYNILSLFIIFAKKNPNNLLSSEGEIDPFDETLENIDEYYVYKIFKKVNFLFKDKYIKKKPNRMDQVNKANVSKDIKENPEDKKLAMGLESIDIDYSFRYNFNGYLFENFINGENINYRNLNMIQIFSDLEFVSLPLKGQNFFDYYFDKNRLNIFTSSNNYCTESLLDFINFNNNFVEFNYNSKKDKIMELNQFKLDRKLKNQELNNQELNNLLVPKVNNNMNLNNNYDYAVNKVKNELKDDINLLKYNCKDIKENIIQEDNTCRLEYYSALPQTMIYFLSKQTKNDFLDEVDRSSREDKLMGLYNHIDYFIIEMIYNYYGNHKNGIYKLWIYYEVEYGLNFFLSFVNNGIFIGLLYKKPSNENYQKPFDGLNYTDYNNENLDILLFYMIILQICYCVFMIGRYLKHNFQRLSLKYYLKYYYKYYLEEDIESMTKTIEEKSLIFQKIRIMARIEPSNIYKFFPYGSYKFIALMKVIFFNKIIYSYYLTIIFLLISFKWTFFISLPLIFFYQFVSPVGAIFNGLRKKWKSIVSLFVFLFIVLYMFSVISLKVFPHFFNFGQSDVIDENSKNIEHEEEGFCYSSFQCLLYFFNKGLSAEGNLGLHNISYRESVGFFYQDFFYELLFFIFTNLIIANVLTGLIGDSFDDYKRKMDADEYDKKNRCFICNISREETTRHNIDFDDHIRVKHNMWKYVNIIADLMLREENEFTYEENYIWSMIKNKNISWFPEYKNE